MNQFGVRRCDVHNIPVVHLECSKCLDEARILELDNLLSNFGARFLHEICDQETLLAIEHGLYSQIKTYCFKYNFHYEELIIDVQPQPEPVPGWENVRGVYQSNGNIEVSICYRYPLVKFHSIQSLYAYLKYGTSIL